MTHRVLVTGAGGLIGHHVRGALHAANGAARFRQEDLPWDVRLAHSSDFDLPSRLTELAVDADLVVHLAGVNRASDDMPADRIGVANRDVAAKLARVLDESGSGAHVVYANSTHSEGDSDYGRGKQAAADVLAESAEQRGAKFSNMVLPHVFGEESRPFYNTVTATLCHQLIHDQTPTIHEGAEVELVHAGDVADRMLDSFAAGHSGRVRMEGVKFSVADLFQSLQQMKARYDLARFPALDSDINVRLFNTYRRFLFPDKYPLVLPLNTDERGVLYEVARGGSGGQSFLSTTHPGVRRGDHFHRFKIERFMVVQGEATISIRSIFNDKVVNFDVNGEKPVAIDMPTLHTHSIVNTGTKPLITCFWAHEEFDPEHPDTFHDPVHPDETTKDVDFA